MNFRLLLSTSAACGALALLAGCTTPAPSSAQANQPAPSKAAASDDPAQKLKPGMSPTEVREVMGQPDLIRPMEAPIGTSEVWVFHRDVLSNVGLAITGTREVPYVDPLTGVTRTIHEPVYNQQTVTTRDRLELLWFDGKLVTWKIVRDRSQSYQ